MISFISGELISLEDDSAIVKTQGVGYELNCSTLLLDNLSVGDFVDFWVYTHVREDALTLFGFKTPSEKKFFLSLLKVSGIGPKMAIKILSAMSFERIAELIDQGDVKSLVKLPKIGKKTAEQMVLTLKGKLVINDENIGQRSPVHKEISSALIHLGFRANDVEAVVTKIDEGLPLQAGIRLGLEMLSGN